jgi:hypothetical protein
MKFALVLFSIFLFSILFLSSVFATTDEIGSTDNSSAGFDGYIYWFPINASASGYLKSIGVNFLSPGADSSFRVAIYNDTLGVPDTLLNESVSQLTAAGWVDLSVTGVTINVGITYWLAFQVNSSEPDIYLNDSGTFYNISYSYDVFPLSLPGGSIIGENITINMRMTYLLYTDCDACCKANQWDYGQCWTSSDCALNNGSIGVCTDPYCTEPPNYDCCCLNNVTTTTSTTTTTIPTECGEGCDVEGEIFGYDNCTSCFTNLGDCTTVCGERNECSPQEYCVEIPDGDGGDWSCGCCCESVTTSTTTTTTIPWTCPRICAANGYVVGTCLNSTECVMGGLYGDWNTTGDEYCTDRYIYCCCFPKRRLTNFGNASFNPACCPISSVDCLDNETLVQTWNINGLSYIATAVCPYGCDILHHQCFQGSILNIIILSLLVIFGIFLTFVRKDPILNILGSMLFIMFGMFLYLQGVVLPTCCPVTMTGYIVKNYVTQLIALIFIGFALYKLFRTMIKFYRATTED